LNERVATRADALAFAASTSARRYDFARAEPFRALREADEKRRGVKLKISQTSIG
jgi:hypothetical protein